MSIMTVPCESDPERMFPVAESRRSGARTDGERRALDVCATCPVLAACSRAARDMEMPYGVAGGMTAADRRAIRAADRRPAATAVAA
ncbi:WhiB family transcriptional regulator [Pseudonocardia sp. ICBG1122]|nr:WhiB family transcriptional regulator [Pseudonocardia pini]